MVMDHGHGHGHGHGQPLAGRGTTMDHAMDQTQPGAVGGGHTATVLARSSTSCTHILSQLISLLASCLV